MASLSVTSQCCVSVSVKDILLYSSELVVWISVQGFFLFNMYCITCKRMCLKTSCIFCFVFPSEIFLWNDKTTGQFCSECRILLAFEYCYFSEFSEKKGRIKIKKKIRKTVREEEIWYWDVNHANHWNCRLKTKKSQRRSKRKNYIGFRSSWRQKKMK